MLPILEHAVANTNLVVLKKLLARLFQRERLVFEPRPKLRRPLVLFPEEFVKAEIDPLNDVLQRLAGQITPPTETLGLFQFRNMLDETEL